MADYFRIIIDIWRVRPDGLDDSGWRYEVKGMPKHLSNVGDRAAAIAIALREAERQLREARGLPVESGPPDAA